MMAKIAHHFLDEHVCTVEIHKWPLLGGEQPHPRPGPYVQCGESEINKLWRSATPPASCAFLGIRTSTQYIFNDLFAYIIRMETDVLYPLARNHNENLLETSSRDVMLSKFKALFAFILYWILRTCAFYTGGNNFMNVKWSSVGCVRATAHTNLASTWMWW